MFESWADEWSPRGCLPACLDLAACGGGHDEISTPSLVDYDHYLQSSGLFRTLSDGVDPSLQ